MALHSDSLLPDDFDTSSFFQHRERCHFYADVLSGDIRAALDSYSNFALDRSVSAHELEHIDSMDQLAGLIESHLVERRHVEPARMSDYLPFNVLPDDTWSAF